MNNKKPLLVLLSGPPLSGKSEIGNMLVARENTPLIEMDSVREELYPEGSNTAEERLVSYRAMHMCARELFQAGVDKVILIATYQPVHARNAVRAMVERLSLQFLPIQFKVAPDIADQRFSQRPQEHAAKDLTAARVRELADVYPYWFRAPTIDTSTCTRDEVLAGVIGYISNTASLELFVSEWVDCL